MKKINKSTIITAIVILLFGLGICNLIDWMNECTEYKYELREMNDGIYAIYYNTHSSIPAQNYEVVTLCCQGHIYTFKGSVNITYIDNRKPYAEIRSYNRTNGDEVDIYVSQGTVEYKESVNISR